MEPRGPDVAVPDGTELVGTVLVGVVDEEDGGDEDGEEEVTGLLLVDPVPWRHFKKNHSIKIIACHTAELNSS